MLVLTQDEFLAELRIQLHGLPRTEIDKIIDDYEQLFTEKLKSGQTVEGILADLKEPKQLGLEIKEGYRSRSYNSSDSVRQFIVALFLIFFNLTFVLAPLLALFGIYIGLIVASAGAIFSPLAVIIKFIIGNGQMFDLFQSFIFTGIGLIVFPLLLQAGSYGIKGLEKYFNWNMKLIRGES